MTCCRLFSHRQNCIVFYMVRRQNEETRSKGAASGHRKRGMPRRTKELFSGTNKHNENPSAQEVQRDEGVLLEAPQV